MDAPTSPALLLTASVAARLGPEATLRRNRRRRFTTNSSPTTSAICARAGCARATWRARRWAEGFRREKGRRDYHRFARGRRRASDFPNAAEFVNRFVPRGKSFFPARIGSGRERTFTSDRVRVTIGFLWCSSITKPWGRRKWSRAFCARARTRILIGEPPPARA